MSIFDNVSSIKSSAQVALLIKLKYGQVSVNHEWLDTIPDAVIHAAFKKSYAPGSIEYRMLPELAYRDALRRYLLRSEYREQVTRALESSLIEYHTLLG